MSLFSTLRRNWGHWQVFQSEQRTSKKVLILRRKAEGGRVTNLFIGKERLLRGSLVT